MSLASGPGFARNRHSAARPGRGERRALKRHGYALSETATHTTGSKLLIQDDSNLVLCAPTRAALRDSAVFSGHPARYLRPPTEVVSLASGTSVSSVDRATHLAMQTVGNFVLYNGAWQAQTSGSS